MHRPPPHIRLMILRAPDDEGAGPAPAAEAPLSISDAVGLLRGARQAEPPPSAEPPAEAAQAPDIPNADPASEPGSEQAPAGEPQEPNGESQAEPAEPAIQPPSTWKPELQAKWAALPPDLQRDLAQWETERNSGVGQKLEASAKAEKEAKAALDAVGAERTQYVGTLNALAQEILGQMGQEPDWTHLAAEDPAGYVQQKAQWDEHQRRLHRVFGERRRVEDRQAGESAQALKQTLATENARMIDAVPGWKGQDGMPTAAASKEFGEVMGYLGKDYGYAKDQLDAVTDHRLVVLARKAMLYDRAQAGLKAAPKPVPQVQRPGTAPSKGEQQAASRDALVKRLERGGTVADAVALLRASRK